MEETQKRIESIVKSNRTPIEKYADTVAELNTLFAQGLIDPNTFSNGLTNAVSDALGRAVESRKVEEKALRSGGIAGLQDAFNMVQRGALSDPLTDATKDAAKAARESAKASNKNASALDIATDLLRKGIPVFVGR